jgi:hypothetical protein
MEVQRRHAGRVSSHLTFRDLYNQFGDPTKTMCIDLLACLAASFGGGNSLPHIQFRAVCRQWETYASIDCDSNGDGVSSRPQFSSAMLTIVNGPGKSALNGDIASALKLAKADL